MLKKYQIGGLIAFIYCFLVLGYYVYTSIGIGLAVYFMISFVDKIGKEYPIKELIVLLPLLQWVVGAKLSYIFGKVHYKYYMYVEEEVYMSYVVPAVILLILGLYAVKGSFGLSNLKNTFGSSNFEKQNRIAKTLVLIGIASTILSSVVKGLGGLGFIFYLSSLLLYVGVSYLFFLYPKRKLLLYFFTLLYLLAVSIAKGSFHNLLLVGIFLLFIVFSNKASFLLKVTVIVLGVFMTYSIQLIKHEYRSQVWGNENVNYFEIFTGLLVKEYLGGGESSARLPEEQGDQEDQAGVNIRLNQGWIISKVLENVPKNQEFYFGKTIVETLEASLLPRFLFPNKPGAEVALQNFRDISGLRLNNSTSMGLSIVAEFYANFGVLGGWIAMFVYGLFLAIVIKWLLESRAHGSDIMLLWFLFFFFQVVKAETDLIKIVNHLFKSIIFFVLLSSLLRVINIQLFPKTKEYQRMD